MMSATTGFPVDWPDSVWLQNVFDEPWKYGYIPPTDTFFYAIEDNLFIDEWGNVVDILDYVTPNELYLFKHQRLPDDMYFLRRTEVPWKTNAPYDCIHLVYPNNLPY